jgi:hypothetical protein
VTAVPGTRTGAPGLSSEATKTSSGIPSSSRRAMAKVRPRLMVRKKADGVLTGRAIPCPNGVGPKVHDAFATLGVTSSLEAELTALDVIGYNFAAQVAVPEPGTLALLVLRRSASPRCAADGNSGFRRVSPGRFRAGPWWGI